MSTTIRISTDENIQLRRTAKKHRIKKSELLRLCLEIGLPRADAGLSEMKQHEGEKFLAMDAEQLAEARSLYKSAVTDAIEDIDHLDGKEFVTAVEKILASKQAWLDVPQSAFAGQTIAARSRRFLAVYAQLF